MSYSLNITDEADELIDSIIYYLVYKLKSKQAARNLLEEIQKVYDAIAENPYLFQETEDLYLKHKGYHKVPVKNYVILYTINEIEKVVNISGVFHDLENYKNKL